VSETERSLKLIEACYEINDIIFSLKKLGVNEGIIDMLNHALMDLEEEVSEEEWSNES